MSRKDEKNDEIIKVLRQHEQSVDINFRQYSAVLERKYHFIASDIRKLFEVEGKVEYVLQKFKNKKWIELLCFLELEVAKTHKARAENFFTEKPELRIIKRVTTDQIIKE